MQNREKDTDTGAAFGASRRTFLTRSAQAASVLAAFTIVPSHVLGNNGAVAPSGKLNLAAVGIAGQGATNINDMKTQNIVALCDVDRRHAGGMFRQFPDARQYSDYRVLLEEEGDRIDAVIVSTPDHMHAPVSLAAMARGKHVYCEKPLTHTVQESRRMAEMAAEKGLTTQMGNQGMASENTRLLCEWIAAGAIGPVREAHLWTDRPTWPQGIGRPSETPDAPDSLSWDEWLGCAPERPYNPAYLPFKWRGWRDFGTGALGDMGCHYCAPVFKALNLGHPLWVEAHKSTFHEADWQAWQNTETWPHASIVRFHFPARGDMPAMDLTWYDGGLKPRRPAGLPDDRALPSNGTLLIGDDGVMLDNRLLPESRMGEYRRPEKTLPRSIGHREEWIAACKGEGEKPWSSFDFAGLVTQVVLLGNIAMDYEGMLKWDGEAMRFTNNDEANQRLTKNYRQGWGIL